MRGQQQFSMAKDLELLEIKNLDAQRALKGLRHEEATKAYKGLIDAAYKKLALRYHPDRNPAPDAEEQMKLINAARDRLMSVKFNLPIPSRPMQQPMGKWSQVIIVNAPAAAWSTSGTSTTTSAGWSWGSPWTVSI